MSTQQNEAVKGHAGGKGDGTLQPEKKICGDSHAASEAKSSAMSVGWNTDVLSYGSPASQDGSPSRSDSNRKGSGHHDGHQKRVTINSTSSETGSHQDGQDPNSDRRSHVSRRRTHSRKHTELTFDIVVEKETEPEFVAELHDLTKEKYDAQELLLQETSLSSEQEKQGKKKEKKQAATWRKYGKTASKAKLLEEKMGDQKRFGVKLRNKFWVPTIINPLEIRLRKSQKKELKEVFELIENPRIGMVTIEDIGAVVGACGSEPTPALVDDILRKIDPLHPGYLTSEEFEEILRFRLEEQDPTEDIERAFKMMSRSRKDRVGLEDLREVSKLVDYPLSDDELMEMINSARPTGSGPRKEATLAGFVQLMTSPNWYDAPKTTKRKKEKGSVFKQDRVYRQISPPLTK